MKWLATLLAAALLAATPAWADDTDKQGKVEIEGVITAVDPPGGFVVIRGEKGRTWVVAARGATEVEFEGDDDDEHLLPPAGLQDLQVGDKVEIKGLRLSDGRVLALKINVEGRRPALPLVVSAGTLVRGVIIVISDRQFILVAQGRNVTVVIQSTTRFVRSAQPISARKLSKYDVVLVRGRLAGDRLLADEVEEEFDAGEGVVFTGVVGVLWPQGGAFLLAGMPIWVNITSRTFIIHGQSAATFGIIQPNASVVVYGLGRGPATQAMVVVVR